MDLAGRTVLITGASQGIGAATARAMAARGAEVLLLARGEDRLREVAATIWRGGGRARVYPVDLADLDAVAATTAAIKSDGIVPDVIVNNAGIGRWLFIEETPLQEMQEIMAVIPRSAAEEPGPPIELRPMGPEPFTWPVALVRRARRRRPPAAKAFLALAIARAEAAPAVRLAA
ncbi:MAG TPA: SDR family NAD(P)-dependent oxidoreductase [Solirubrobacteraceae bacterium]|jgi:NAD(P)-dependent dehydrogenase (short-subunit alcohol dehydrogenase family)